jgi:membrane protein YqaA with SNARE-associated domain
MKKWLKRIRAALMHWTTTKWGALVLFISALADASILPLPTPFIFLTMALIDIKKAYRYALICTVGIVLGSVAGYWIGEWAWMDSDGNFTKLANFMFNTIPGFSIESYNLIHIELERWNFWLLFVASFLPLPYNIFAITSGVFGINIYVFFIATIIGQASRFYLLAFLVKKLGPRVLKLLEFNKKPILLIALTCIVIAIIMIKVF